MLASEHVMAHTYTYTSYVLHAYSYTTISFKFIESFFYIAKICKQKPDLVGKLIWCLKFISFTWYIVCCVCVAALRVRLYMCEGILSACHNFGSPTHTHKHTRSRQHAYNFSDDFCFQKCSVFWLQSQDTILLAAYILLVLKLIQKCLCWLLWFAYSFALVPRYCLHFEKRAQTHTFIISMHMRAVRYPIICTPSPSLCSASLSFSLLRSQSMGEWKRLRALLCSVMWVCMYFALFILNPIASN